MITLSNYCITFSRNCPFIPVKTNNSYFDNNGGAWTQYSISLTAPASADGFYFEVRTYSGAIVYWDDFSFSDVTPTDVTAPSFTATYPKSQSTTASGFDVAINLDEIITYSKNLE